MTTDSNGKRARSKSFTCYTPEDQYQHYLKTKLPNLMGIWKKKCWHEVQLVQREQFKFYHQMKEQSDIRNRIGGCVNYPRNNVEFDAFSRFSNEMRSFSSTYLQINRNIITLILWGLEWRNCLGRKLLSIGSSSYWEIWIRKNWTTAISPLRRECSTVQNCKWKNIEENFEIK